MRVPEALRWRCQAVEGVRHSELNFSLEAINSPLVWVSICMLSLTAIEVDTKLLITWLVSGRDGDHAIAFMDDLRDRLANRVQLTSDGHKAYLEAVEGAFGGDVDYRC